MTEGLAESLGALCVTHAVSYSFKYISQIDNACYSKTRISNNVAQLSFGTLYFAHQSFIDIVFLEEETAHTDSDSDEEWQSPGNHTAMCPLLIGSQSGDEERGHPRESQCGFKIRERDIQVGRFARSLLYDVESIDALCRQSAHRHNLAASVGVKFALGSLADIHILMFERVDIRTQEIAILYMVVIQADTITSPRHIAFGISLRKVPITEILMLLYTHLQEK